jgi:hypothetical protein
MIDASLSAIAARMVDMMQKRLLAEVYDGLLVIRTRLDGAVAHTSPLLTDVQRLIDKIENAEQHRVG